MSTYTLTDATSLTSYKGAGLSKAYHTSHVEEGHDLRESSARSKKVPCYVSSY